MNTTVAEFGFVESMPKPKKKAALSAVEVLELLKAAFSNGKALVPLSLSVKLLGISRARLYQLIADGRLEKVDIDGNPFITEESIVEFGKSERKAGRPIKQMSWQDAKAFAAGE